MTLTNANTIGNAQNHRLDGLTVHGDLLLTGPQGVSVALGVDSLNTIVVNGTGTTPWHRILQPVFNPGVGVGTNTANAARGVRYIAPITGDIRDVSIYVNTQSGNVDVGIYDAGDANSSVRTKLWSAGSTACAAGGAWQTFDPGAGTVRVKQNQPVDLVVAVDNATTSLARFTNPSGFFGGIPANFMNDAAGTPFFWWQITSSFPLPATLATASFTVNAVSPFYVLARIQPS